SMVERCMVRPPSARVGPITPEERKALMAQSPVKGKYDEAVDSESAYEVLQKRLKETGSTSPPPAGQAGAGQAGVPGGAADAPGGVAQASALGWFGRFMAGVGLFLGGVFGTNLARGTRLSTSQKVAREVARTVSNRVAGQVAADIGKAIGGKT